MNVHRLLLLLTFGLALALPTSCRRAAPPLEEDEDEPAPTPELAQPTAIALATATATAAASAAPTATVAPTATSLPAPSATTPAPTATAAPTASPTSPPSPTTTPCGPPDGWVAYTILAGDTLASLARATATTVAEIQLANCLADTLIFAGSALFLPSLPATPTSIPPPPLVLDGSQPLGTAPVTGTLTYDNAFLVRIDVRRNGAGDQNGDGIARVEFIVSREGAELYRHTDDSAAYCLFGGGAPACSPWPLVGGLYRWGSSGPPVEPGHYLVRAWLYFTPDSDDGSGITHDFWDFSFDLAAPGATPTAP